ncbi:MAG: two-component system response regulator [Pseudanabaena frigida]|uniref:Two-component system response regulator n=1 Tax=Pseudanabaena frigida TaxID=945775 RepID=A0A2W4W4L3_9CYAN|nr:MAG: two-component system response regulator [Pseudanabaena frigida]
MTVVLVVEDTDSERDLIVSYLVEGGYSVISAINGQEALKKIEGRKPDVVITDLVMPGMSGLELCRNLKKNSETKDLPIVACTSKNQELDKLWAMKQGIDVYLTKPFTKEAILQALRSLNIGG